MRSPSFRAELARTGGCLGELIAAFDWTRTSLGPLEKWPQSLRTTVALIVRSRLPMVLLWGEDGVMLYNDAYATIGGARHPALLGSQVRDGWPEVAAFNENVMRVGLAGGALTYVDQELTLYRNGAREQVWMNLDYSPAPGDDGQPAGVIAVVVETTQRVLAEQRIEAERLRLLQAFEQAPSFLTVMDGPEHRVTFANQAHRASFGSDTWVGKSIREAFPDLEGQGIFELLDGVYTSGERYVARSQAVQFRPPGAATMETRYLDFIYEPMRDARGAVTGILCEGSDVTDRHRAEVHRKLLVDELNHRVKNTLAVVQGLAQQSFRGDAAQPEARSAFEGRLVALAHAHNVLTSESWEAADLADIVRDAAGAWKDLGDRFSASGPRTRIEPQTAVSLALALHELGTNALKYGALSTPLGRVEVSWCVAEHPRRALVLRWVETGGPPVHVPIRRGFGTRLIERSMAGESGGDVRLDYRAAGLICELHAPLAGGRRQDAFLALRVAS